MEPQLIPRANHSSPLRTLAWAALLIYGFGQVAATGFLKFRAQEAEDFLVRSQPVEARLVSLRAEQRTGSAYNSTTRQNYTTHSTVQVLTLETRVNGQARQHVVEAIQVPPVPVGGVLPARMDPARPLELRIEGVNHHEVPAWIVRGVAFLFCSFFYFFFAITVGMRAALARAPEILAFVEKRAAERNKAA